MFQCTSHLRSLLIGLLRVYLFIYPFAILLIAFDRVPVWGTWVGGALLILQGTMMGLWLTASYGQRGVVAAVLILVISWAVEHFGEGTGFPFGHYTYTEVLVPRITGSIPLAIPFAWLLVVPAAVGVMDRLMDPRRLMSEEQDDQRQPEYPRRITTRIYPYQHTRARTLVMIVLAASFATLLDVTIEPVAVHINNYWVWSHMGGYYDVPLSNFAAWWGLSALLVAIMLWLRQSLHTDASGENLLHGTPWLARLPLWLYLLNLTMFTLVNLARGQIAAAVIGILLLSYLAFDWLEPAVVRWVMGGIKQNKPTRWPRRTTFVLSGTPTIARQVGRRGDQYQDDRATVHESS